MNAPETQHPKTLLLVEDDAIIAYTTAQILQKHGYRVITVTNGDDAVRCARERPEIDLVLMDIQLGPGMDGTQAARLILLERDMPLVFLSGHADRDIIEKTEKITSYGFVEKGTGENVLLASIKMAFKLYEANRQLVERELRLEKSEKRYRALFENSREAFALFDDKGMILYEGPAIQRMTGYSIQERLGKNGLELVYPEDLSMVISTFTRIVNQPGCQECLQFRSTRKDGSLWWVEVIASNLLHEPAVQAVVVNLRDITLRKQAEQALVDSEARYRLLLHSGNDAIFVNAVGPDNLLRPFMEVNQKCCEMLGYEQDELLSLSPEDVHVTEGSPSMASMLAEIVHNKRAMFEVRMRRKDGSLIDVELSSHLIETGQDKEIFTIARDITGRKKAEIALRKSEEQFRLVWSESPIAKELYDAGGVLVDVNRACLNLFGVDSFDDVRGFRLFDDPNLTSDVKQRLLAGESVNYEFPFDFDKVHEIGLYQTRKTGKIQISLQVTPLRFHGETSGYLVQAQDITLRKQAEDALALAVEEKSMLLSDLQHRIKNSLALIASLIMLGQHKARGDETKYALEELYNRVKALSGLYEVLYGSTGAHEISLDVYLRQIAESLAASYFHHQKGISLQVDCEALRVDTRCATPLGLILNELLTNALKYAFPEGQGGLISVLLRRCEPDCVELVVSNDGVLIAEDFDLQRSSGLGLQIVQMLVGQLQGSMTCRRGEQTVFRVQVPLQNLLLP